MEQKRKFVIKKKLTTGKSEFRQWDHYDEGDVLIGKLIGTSPNNKNPSKKDWIVEVLDAQFKDAAAAAKVQGKNILLNSAGMLDKAMEKVEEGQIVQVTYNGKHVIEKGKWKGSNSHTMDVLLVDEESGEDHDNSDL